MGVFLAFIAMIAWGVADFLVQKCTRKLGSTATLFYIACFGVAALSPFIVAEIPNIILFEFPFWLLMGASSALLFASLLDFESLRRGKMTVVEPVYALEVPITIALASLVLSEQLTLMQGGLVAVLIVSVLFVSLESLRVLKKFRFEKGVILALAATVGMACANFLFGVGARQTSPLLINWFSSAVIASIMGVYLIRNNQLKNIKRQLRKSPKLILSVGAIDTLAWIAYTTSAIQIPIGIATAISESYIAVAAILGFVINRELLATHQKIGLACAVISAVILAGTSV